MDFDWKSLVRTVAPAIATAFGTPLAGMAVSAVANAILPPDQAAGATEAQVAAALQGATPDQLLALKKADQDFAVQMRNLDIDLEKIAAGDRDSARKMQADTHDWTPRVLAVLLTGGFFAVLAYMIRFGIPAGAGNEALLIMVGNLGAAFTAVIAFFYGSSASSKAKDDTLKAAVRR